MGAPSGFGEGLMPNAKNQSFAIYHLTFLSCHFEDKPGPSSAKMTTAKCQMIYGK